MKRCVVAAAVFFALACSKPPIVVGSKNFTESVILGELLAQTLESQRCTVDRRLNMGGSLVCDSAIASGSLDAYVEYSGTALTAILHQQATNDRAAVDRIVSAAYAKRGLRWGPNLGVKHTFAVIVRRESAPASATGSSSVPTAGPASWRATTSTSRRRRRRWTSASRTRRWRRARSTSSPATQRTA